MFGGFLQFGRKMHYDCRKINFKTIRTIGARSIHSLVFKMWFNEPNHNKTR